MLLVPPRLSGQVREYIKRSVECGSGASKRTWGVFEGCVCARADCVVIARGDAGECQWRAYLIQAILQFLRLCVLSAVIAKQFLKLVEGHAGVRSSVPESNTGRAMGASGRNVLSIFQAFPSQQRPSSESVWLSSRMGCKVVQEPTQQKGRRLIATGLRLCAPSAIGSWAPEV
jgi:hypothetical protein